MTSSPADQSPGRPEPVTKAGAVAGAVAALILAVGGLLRVLGWQVDGVDELAVQASNAVLAAGALWFVAAPPVLAWFARQKVTPLADPRDARGVPLEPVVPRGVDVDALYREYFGTAP